MLDIKNGTVADRMPGLMARVGLSLGLGGLFLAAFHPADRGQGWQVAVIAREAWLDPRCFSLAPPSRSGLRRKLRRAGAAGVQVAQDDPLPLAEMARIAASWARAHGGERGFSMGRYASCYGKNQKVFLARRDGRLVGFASFHCGSAEWVLDLMRHGEDAVDGTMHALVTAAIAEAGRLQVPRLSLAAVPQRAFGGARPIDRALARFGCDGAGLLQFKAAFAPHWQPLYLAAPHRPGLALAACEIARAIACPPPLRQSEQDHAEFEFATARSPWHTRDEQPLSTRGSDV